MSVTQPFAKGTAARQREIEMKYRNSDSEEQVGMVAVKGSKGATPAFEPRPEETQSNGNLLAW